MRSLLCCLLLAITGTVMAAPDVFKCVGDQGQTTYTLGACPAGSQVSVIPLQPSANGFNPAPPAANPPPAAVASQQQDIIIIPPAPRPADGITIVGGPSASSSSSSSSSIQRGSGIIYQPYPVYIERPRHETWHMVPHPQAMQPPPAPPSPGIPIDR